MSTFSDRVVIPDYQITERYFQLPLDHGNPASEKIQVFARISVPLERVHDQDKLPYMNFINGGPGLYNFPGNRPWHKEVYQRGYKMIFIDQRGTGLSSPISARSLAKQFKTSQEKADYLKHFRADSIVRDFEAIRLLLLGDKTSPAERKWSLFGQSFGGFIITTYLSFFPDGIKEAIMTGGLPPLVDNPDPVYTALYPRVIARNEAYYQKYPQDVERARAIVEYISKNQITTPNGGNLTPERLQYLGIDMGMHGGMYRMHLLLLEGANDLKLTGELGYKFLKQVENTLDGSPLYAIMHEPIYCQGKAHRWSSQRLRPTELDWATALKKNQPFYFTGENIYPRHFQDFAELRDLQETAEILAAYDGWGPLYDEEQLKKNKVPVAAAVYYNDTCVDVDHSIQTGKLMGAEMYITSRYLHNGVSEDTDVTAYLFKLLRGDVDR